MTSGHGGATYMMKPLSSCSPDPNVIWKPRTCQGSRGDNKGRTGGYLAQALRVLPHRPNWTTGRFILKCTEGGLFGRKWLLQGKAWETNLECRRKLMRDSGRNNAFCQIR